MDAFQHPQTDVVFYQCAAGLQTFFLPQSVFLIQVMVGIHHHFYPTFHCFLNEGQQVVAFKGADGEEGRHYHHFPVGGLEGLTQDVCMSLKSGQTADCGRLTGHIERLAQEGFLVLVEKVGGDFALLTVEQPLGQVARRGVSVGMEDVHVAEHQEVVLRTRHGHIEHIVLSACFHKVGSVFG